MLKRVCVSRLYKAVAAEPRAILVWLVFLTFVLLANWEVFFFMQIETGDSAANALQVQQAKHFSELLGNYSRWHFHHPGPFFFYLFAAGEGFFYNLLHVVPAPLNGECLAEIIFSTFCLFCSIHVFSRHAGGSLFLPLSMLVILSFLSVVEGAFPSSAIVSVWPPYMVLFSFLLMLTSSASVAAGTWTHIPLLVFSSMVMLHAHVAQIVFVAALMSFGVGSAVLKSVKARDLRARIRLHKVSIIISLALLLVFLFPIIVELFVHTPNNVGQIATYLRLHRGERNSLKTAFLYEFSFLTFYPSPEILLTNKSASFTQLLRSDILVRAHWAFLASISMTALLLSFRNIKPLTVFIKIIWIEIGLILVLFTYWSVRITGPMYSFNGFFFFSVPLFSTLAICAVISSRVDIHIRPKHQIIFACISIPLLVLNSGIRHGRSDSAEVRNIVHALSRNNIHQAHLIFESSTWPIAAGVASLLNRSGSKFCVDESWGFVLDHVCHDQGNYQRVAIIRDNKNECQHPCSVLYSGANILASVTPPHALLLLPALIRASEQTYDAKDINELDGQGFWTTKHSGLEFRISPQSKKAHHYQIGLLGTSLGGRPVYVHLNNRLLGQISGEGRSIVNLRADRLNTSGGVNKLEILVPAAGPVGPDVRTLGYLFEELSIKPIDFEMSDEVSQTSITASSADSQGGIIHSGIWKMTGGWTRNGQHPSVGQIPGRMWGSWSGSDSLTGTIESQIFSSKGNCVVIPVSHGPSTVHQSVSVRTLSGSTISFFPTKLENGPWAFYKIQLHPPTDAIFQAKIVSDDRGSAFGEWVAVGEPRSCVSSD